MVFGWQPFLESSFIHDSGDGVCMAILTKFCTALCWRRWSAVQVGHEWPTCVCCEYSRSGGERLVLPLKTGQWFVMVGQEPSYVFRGFAKTPRAPPATPPNFILLRKQCLSLRELFQSPPREGQFSRVGRAIMPDIFLKSAMNGRPTFALPQGKGAYRRFVLLLKTGRLFVEVGQDPPYVFRGFAKTPRAASNPTSLPQGKECIAVHRKFQTRRAAEDSTRLYGAGFPKKWLRHFLGCPVGRRNTV